MSRNPSQPWAEISSECQSFQKLHCSGNSEGGCGDSTCVNCCQNAETRFWIKWVWAGDFICLWICTPVQTTVCEQNCKSRGNRGTSAFYRKPMETLNAPKPAKEHSRKHTLWNFPSFVIIKWRGIHCNHGRKFPPSAKASENTIVSGF